MDKETGLPNDVLLEGDSHVQSGKPSKKTFKDNMLSTAYRHKFLHSLSLYMTFICLGFQVGQRGPSFLDIQLITNTDVEKASTFFTAGSVGYMCGSLVSGIIYDRFNKVLLLCISMVCLALTVTFLPLCSLYGVMLVIFWANSFCMAFVNTGGNAHLISIWGEVEGRPYMQALHFSVAFGGIVSPLITAPFLSPHLQTTTNISESATDVGISNNFSVLQFPFVHTATTLSAQLQQNTSYNDSLRSGTFHIISSVGTNETNLIYAYIISGVLTSVTSIPLIIIYCSNRSKKGLNILKKDDEVKAKRGLPLKYNIVAILLLCLMFMSNCAIENMFEAYLLTFVVMHFKWSKVQGSQISSVFWASFATSRFTGIFLARCLKPGTILVVCLCTLVFNLSALLLCAHFYYDKGVWVCTTIAGLSMAAIFPTGLTWINENVFKVTGRITSCILVASSSGAMLNTLLTGYLTQEYGIIWYCYLLLGESLLCLLMFLILFLFAKFVFIKVRF